MNLRHACWAAALAATLVPAVAAPAAGPLRRIGAGLGRILGVDRGERQRRDSQAAEPRPDDPPAGWELPELGPRDGSQTSSGAAIEGGRSPAGSAPDPARPNGSRSAYFIPSLGRAVVTVEPPSGRLRVNLGSPWVRSRTGSFYAVYRDRSGRRYYALIYPELGTETAYYFDPAARQYLGVYDYATRKYRPYDSGPGRWRGTAPPPFGPPPPPPAASRADAGGPDSDPSSAWDRTRARSRIAPPDPIPAERFERDQVRDAQPSQAPPPEPIPERPDSPVRDQRVEPSRIPPPPPLPADLAGRSRERQSEPERTSSAEPLSTTPSASEPNPGLTQVPPPAPVPAAPSGRERSLEQGRTPPPEPLPVQPSERDRESDSDDGPTITPGS